MDRLFPFPDTDSGPLWVKTPLVHSRSISARLGLNVYLKMENLQPSLSFEFRWVSHLVQEARKKHGWDLHVIVASNDDAALATACASKALSSPCTVFVTRDASQDLIKSLKLEEAIVVVGGDTDSEALEQAKAAAAANPHAVLVPAGDDQVLWNECESMIFTERSVMPTPNRL